LLFPLAAELPGFSHPGRTDMATKTKSRPAPTFPELDSITELLRTPPITTHDRVIRINALAKRMNGYIKYMCGVARQNGISDEAKHRAIAMFYDSMVRVEHELARIHDSYRLE
jgi:hypothetical protein